MMWVSVTERVTKEINQGDDVPQGWFISRDVPIDGKTQISSITNIDSGRCGLTRE
jgi:hypothetical protein